MNATGQAQRAIRWVSVMLAAILALPVFAAGPPPASFPERFAKPDSDSERNAKCDKYGQRLERSRGIMGDSRSLSRVGWFKARHRKMERYVKEYCGNAGAHNFELSHRAVASGVRPPISQPAVTGWDHPVHWYKGSHGESHDDHGGGHSDDHGDSHGDDHGDDHH